MLLKYFLLKLDIFSDYKPFIHLIVIPVDCCNHMDRKLLKTNSLINIKIVFDQTNHVFNSVELGACPVTYT